MCCSCLRAQASTTSWWLDPRRAALFAGAEQLCPGAGMARNEGRPGSIALELQHTATVPCDPSNSSTLPPVRLAASALAWIAAIAESCWHYLKSRIAPHASSAYHGASPGAPKRYSTCLGLDRVGRAASLPWVLTLQLAHLSSSTFRSDGQRARGGTTACTDRRPAPARQSGFDGR